MPKYFSMLMPAAVLSSSLFAAVTVPSASDKNALNLQHYLEYRLGNEITFACTEETKLFRCLSKNQESVETDENNVTTKTSFQKAELHFGSAIASVLEKRSFQQTMDEIRQSASKSVSGKKDAPLRTHREDSLVRTLIGNLDFVRVDMLNIDSTDPSAHIHFDTINYKNRMKKTAKDIIFSERIFGDISLSYRNGKVDSNDTDSFYKTVPLMLENWLDTNNTKRAQYVGRQLQSLYAEELKSPANGEFHFRTSYLGHNTITLKIEAKNANRHNASEHFDFSGELHNASTLFKPDQELLTPGVPDFLFKSMRSVTVINAGNYRTLLKKDKQFSQYMNEYNTLIQSHYEHKMKVYRQNSVLSGWFNQAKTAFSKLLKGDVDTLEIEIKNKSGVTAMQAVGMVMGQLLTMSSKTGTEKPDQEKIIADTAAQNLDIHIRTR